MICDCRSSEGHPRPEEMRYIVTFQVGWAGGVLPHAHYVKDYRPYNPCRYSWGSTAPNPQQEA